MSSSDPISTDAEVASPAFIDKDNVEGDTPPPASAPP